MGKAQSIFPFYEKEAESIYSLPLFLMLQNALLFAFSSAR